MANLSCQGQGAPMPEQMDQLIRVESTEPEDPTVLTGSCGNDRHALQGEKRYNTTDGATVHIRYLFTPVGQ